MAFESQENLPPLSYGFFLFLAKAGLWKKPPTANASLLNVQSMILYLLCKSLLNITVISALKLLQSSCVIHKGGCLSLCLLHFRDR